ncbi:hypothetical protein I4U23_006550 [Adineta vaga]|nr:hypothetical protein I4U23_006550 [Adineta vaga]
MIYSIRRVQMTLNEKQMNTSKQQMICLDKNEHRTKPFIDQNSRGQVPSFKIGNLILNQSLAICLYLENKMKNQGTILLPDNLYLRAQVIQCIFDSIRLQKIGSENVIYYIWHTPQERYDFDLLKKRKETLVNELIRWNKRLKEHNQEIFYATGNLFTLADIFLFSQLAFFVHCGYPIELHEQLNFYYKSLRDRPSIQQSFPPHWTRTTSNILNDCSKFIQE